MTEDLGMTAQRLQLTLDRINNGQGSLAKLLNDGRLYEELLENSHQLDLLIDELRGFVAKAKDKGVPIKLK